MGHGRLGLLWTYFCLFIPASLLSVPSVPITSSCSDFLPPPSIFKISYYQSLCNFKLNSIIKTWTNYTTFIPQENILSRSGDKCTTKPIIKKCMTKIQYKQHQILNTIKYLNLISANLNFNLLNYLLIY